MAPCTDDRNEQREIIERGQTTNNSISVDKEFHQTNFRRYEFEFEELGPRRPRRGEGFKRRGEQREREIERERETERESAVSIEDHRFGHPIIERAEMESKDSFDEGKEDGKHCDEKGYDDGDDRGKEADSDEEVEAEYRAALNKGNVGKVAVSDDPQAKAIVRGFRINWMDMRDADTSRLMWESGEWGKNMYRHELKATVPRRILECSAVSREINFSSQEEIRRFRLEQRVFLNGACLEEWFFYFGFVIPGSTNSWQQTIESAGEDRMLAAEDLSGKMTIETTFLDGKTMLFKTLVRIFYE